MSYLVGALIIGAIIFMVARRGFQMKDLCHKGVLAEGKVIRKFRTHGTSGARGSANLRYEFHASNGQRFENKISVGEEVWDAHEEGSPIVIVYLEDKPQVSAAKYMVNLSREALKMPPL